MWNLNVKIPQQNSTILNHCFMLFHVRCHVFFLWMDSFNNPSPLFPVTYLTVARMVAFFLIWIIPSVLPHSIELPGILGVCRRLSMVGGRFVGDGWGFLNPNPRDTKSPRLNGCNLQKPSKTHQFSGVCDWILQNQSTKKNQNVEPLLPAPGTGNPKDWAATLNRFFTKTHREVATCDIDVVSSWLQACELMMEEIQILWLFQCPELWVESFETDTVFKTKHLAKWEDLWTAEVKKWDTSGCRCRSFIVTWSLQHPSHHFNESLQHECWWCMVSTNLLWISKILAPFVCLCGLWCLLVRGITV